MNIFSRTNPAEKLCDTKQTLESELRRTVMSINMSSVNRHFLRCQSEILNVLIFSMGIVHDKLPHGDSIDRTACERKDVYI